MSILRNTFRYFTQFVPVAVLEAVFRLPSGDDHNELFRELTNMPAERRIPEIEDFLFSISQEGVQQRIANIKGVFLFVDYSSITSSVDRVDVKTDRFHVAITVARPRPKEQDQATEMIWQDKMLDIISAIRKTMRDDLDADASAWWLSFPTTIQPFHAPGLQNSMGWTMEFDITGTDIV